jgi:hypothetical protein
MTIEQTIEIPANHRLTIEVPREIPVGRTIITFTPAPKISATSSPADNSERPTPISDRLLGLASGAGDISLKEDAQPLKPIPKDGNGKILLTQSMKEELLADETLRSLTCILHTDMTIDEIRNERLAKHL